MLTATANELKVEIQGTCRQSPPLVYVAAPYTHPDPVHNTHGVIKIADALLAAGVNPLVPHLTLMWHLVSPKPYECWLEYDRQLLVRCDAVLRVPGKSSGADSEVELAELFGIPVIHPRSPDPADCVSAVLISLPDLERPQ